jgi:hypothetical protein
MEFISVTDSTKKSSALGRRKTLDGVKQRSRWSNGLTFSITGVDVVYDKDSNDVENAYVVLTTAINGQKFDNLFLSTLVRPIVDKDGQEHQPNGELNKVAMQLLNDPSVTTDGQFADRIVQACNGKLIRVKRDQKVVRMGRSGNIYPAMLLEFTF